MGLYLQAKADIEQITSDLDGFGKALKFYDPASGVIAEVVGTFARHWMGFDEQGVGIDAAQAHVSVSEKFFKDAGFPVRASDGEVTMLGKLVNFAGSAEIDRTYIVAEQYPDETIGLIVMILAEYEDLNTPPVGDGGDDDDKDDGNISGGGNISEPIPPAGDDGSANNGR